MRAVLIVLIAAILLLLSGVITKSPRPEPRDREMTILETLRKADQAAKGR